MEDNDQIEDFFRKRIKNYKPESDQWEEDLDDVWNNALPHISKPARASRKIVWSFLLSTLLIGALTYYFIHQKQELNDLKETIIATKNTVQELQQELKELEYQNEQKEEQLKNIDSIAKTFGNVAKIKSEYTAALRQTQNSESTSSIFLDTERSNISNKESAKSSAETFNIEQKDLSKNTSNIGDIYETKPAKNTIVQEKKSSDINLDTLVFAPIAALNIENSKDLKSIKLPKEKLKKVTWVKLKTAPVLINRKLKNFNGPNDPFVRRDFSGLQLGLDLAWDISKRFSIQSGLSYFQFSSKNTHTKSLIFSTDEEQMTPLGLLRTSKSFVLITPIGPSSGNYIFTREPTDFIADGTNINTTFNSKTTIQYLQIPLLLNYKIKDGRCQLYAKAGLVGDIVMKKNFEVEEVFTDNLAFSINRSNINQPKNLQNFTLNYLVGLGLEYRLNKHWSVSLEPTYTRGITPQAKPFGEIEVSLETVSLAAGMKYRF